MRNNNGKRDYIAILLDGVTLNEPEETK